MRLARQNVSTPTAVQIRQLTKLSDRILGAGILMGFWKIGRILISRGGGPRRRRKEQG